MQEKIFEMLFNEDEITWQTMIYEAVRNEQMDLWDIDISLLAQRFLEMLKKLKEMDFRISGKIILAAAILLKLKSRHLVEKDITELDRLISSSEQTEEEFYDELEADLYQHGAVKIGDDSYQLIPRTPQPRKRKVSVYDLVEALNKALEVKRRRVIDTIPDVKIELPKKTTDISVVIQDVYIQIRGFFLKHRQQKLTFTQLIPSDKKEDKVMTFIPLLHLTTQRKIDLFQKVHFGEIEIILTKKADEQAKPVA